MSATDEPQNAHNQRPIYIILGSGGHTAEMCIINQALLQSDKGCTIYSPCRYVVAQSDTTSLAKIRASLDKISKTVPDSAIIEVPRSREVGQSYFTSIFTTLWALIWSCWLVWRDQPRLVLCNGPGTCVPFCIAAYIWRLLRRLSPKSRLVFIESFCRVNTLSLSGRLLLPFVDMLVVQWPALAIRYKHKENVKYFGSIL